MSRKIPAPDPWPAPAPGPNRTGGAVWHARALTAHWRWQPTRDAIAHWLASLRFGSDQLVLVGASAGWMMSRAFLARFRAVTAIDIDPLARPLFALRHGLALRAGGARVRWESLDALARLDELLVRHPEAAVLFDNVLGQQIYRSLDPERIEKALAGLAARLHGREWASIHDWLSGPAAPTEPSAILLAQPQRVRLEGGAVSEAGRVLSWDALAESALARLDAHGEWQDHRTAVVFPNGTEIRLIPWEFRPGKWHWLQAGYVAGGAPPLS